VGRDGSDPAPTMRSLPGDQDPLQQPIASHPAKGLTYQDPSPRLAAASDQLRAAAAPL